jgi:hypothetical protein
MRIFLSFFILIFLAKSITGFAQSPCAISLKNAEDKFDQGRLYEVDDILKACLRNGFTDDEKERAYRLLTLTYLFLNYQEKADSTFMKILQLNPIYETNEDLDPMEMINLGDKFTTKPLYYFTVKAGANFSFVNVLKDYSISKSFNKDDDDKNYKYSSNSGFAMSVGGEKLIWKNFHLAGEIYYNSKRFHLTDTHWDFYTTNIEIIHEEIELPIMLKYNLFSGKVNPFCYVGLSPKYIVKSKANFSGIYRGKDELNQEDEYTRVTDRTDIITTNMKNRFNYAALFGGGINYKIGLNYISVEARFSLGMLNETDVNNRFLLSSQREILNTEGGKEIDPKPFEGGRELKFPPGHIDDDFKINNLSILVGFVRPLYKPRKIK